MVGAFSGIASAADQHVDQSNLQFCVILSKQFCFSINQHYLYRVIIETCIHIFNYHMWEVLINRSNDRICSGVFHFITIMYIHILAMVQCYTCMTVVLLKKVHFQKVHSRLERSTGRVINIFRYYFTLRQSCCYTFRHYYSFIRTRS